MFPKIFLQRRTDLSCQAKPVSQNQVCKRKHHIQFCNLFWQASVSCFSEPKLEFDDGENMLNFCANGGFGALIAFDLALGTGGIVLALTGTLVNEVLDAFAAVVLFLGLKALVRAQIAAVAVDFVLFAG